MAHTNISPTQEMKLVFIVNDNPTKANSISKKFFSMLRKETEFFEKHDLNFDPERSEIDITYKFRTQLASKQFDLLMDEVEMDAEIYIVKWTKGNSVVAWIWCKTRRAVRKLRQMIESGDLQRLFVILFSTLSDRKETIKVELHENTVNRLQWAENYIEDAGKALIQCCQNVGCKCWNLAF